MLATPTRRARRASSTHMTVSEFRVLACRRHRRCRQVEGLRHVPSAARGRANVQCIQHIGFVSRAEGRSARETANWSLPMLSNPVVFHCACFDGSARNLMNSGPRRARRCRPRPIAASRPYSGRERRNENAHRWNAHRHSSVGPCLKLFPPASRRSRLRGSCNRSSRGRPLGMLSESRIFSVSRGYIVPPSGSNGQSEANTIFSSG